jgi:hypothetical protein
LEYFILPLGFRLWSACWTWCCYFLYPIIEVVKYNALQLITAGHFLLLLYIKAFSATKNKKNSLSCLEKVYLSPISFILFNHYYSKRKRYYGTSTKSCF